eukprot:scaffold688_cov105-Cylindrotheca_fusiformis.AAC.1
MRIVLALILLVAVADGFAIGQEGATTSPLAKEAAEIFNKKYPFDRDVATSANPLGSLGVPDKDFDGTELKKSPAQRTEGRRSLADISEEEAIFNFNTIAGIYGEDRAIEMVKVSPLCLAFDSKVLGEVFNIWAEKFGEEETKDMVLRNPGLLSVQPSLAKKTDDSTMVFSYIIAATRPIGAFGPVLIILLILTPLIEAITGIPIRETREALFAGTL